MFTKRLTQVFAIKEQYERNMKTYREETTEANRTVGTTQGYTTRWGWGERGVAVTYRGLGLFRKGSFGMWRYSVLGPICCIGNIDIIH